MKPYVLARAQSLYPALETTEDAKFLEKRLRRNSYRTFTVCCLFEIAVTSVTIRNVVHNLL